ncbi:MAG: class I SAM-dependent methyltransferase [Xanthomonadales bacterium]|nr:class I SAM-dependent methyltransferase [Xanthomonadales bacterium]
MADPHDWSYRAIREKYALRQFYWRAYQAFADTLASTPPKGRALELGAGEGFARELMPDWLTSDVSHHPGLSLIADATRLPFRDRSLRLIALLNVLHHIPDVWAFFAEAERCLLPGGRIKIVDQHLGVISYPILRFMHDEPFDVNVDDLRFASKDPEKDANGAMAWLLFQRDKALFDARFPSLEVVEYLPHTPLMYWLSGGLKRWSLVGRRLYPLTNAIDRGLARLSPLFCSFCDIEIVKR